MRFNYFITSLLLLIMSCSTSVINIPEEKIDFSNMIEFSKNIKSRFKNYAESSGYNDYVDSLVKADSLKNYQNLKEGHIKIGPCASNPIPVFILSSTDSNTKFVFYTFDMIDSGSFSIGPLNDRLYSLSLRSIPIPAGRYFLESGDSLKTIYLP